MSINRQDAAERNTFRYAKQLILRLATTALMAGGIGVAGLGLAPGSAHAGPTWATGPYQWCPGQPLPRTGIEWDMGVCHTWYVLYGVKGNVAGRWTDMWDGDNPPAPIKQPLTNCGLFSCPNPPGS
jgi:hypothetical protein